MSENFLQLNSIKKEVPWLSGPSRYQNGFWHFLALLFWISWCIKHLGPIDIVEFLLIYCIHLIHFVLLFCTALYKVFDVLYKFIIIIMCVISWTWWGHFWEADGLSDQAFPEFKKKEKKTSINLFLSATDFAVTTYIDSCRSSHHHSYIYAVLSYMKVVPQALAQIYSTSIKLGPNISVHISINDCFLTKTASLCVYNNSKQAC